MESVAREKEGGRSYVSERLHCKGERRKNGEKKKKGKKSKETTKSGVSLDGKATEVEEKAVYAR